jgi:hypothetical protein
MKDEKLSHLEKWILKKQEKALAIIGGHTSSDEELLYYATAWTRSSEAPTWIPFIGRFFEMLILMEKKKYLLAVTKKRLLIIGVRKIRFKELSCKEIPIPSIADVKINKFLLSAHLCVDTVDGKSYLFKDLSVERASGIKDAIEETQGKPSSIDEGIKEEDKEFVCSICGSDIKREQEHCPNCGSEIDWSEC